MKKVAIALVASATAVSGIAGCSSQDEGSPTTAAATPSASADVNKPVHKAVGEKAYWGCNAKSEDCPLVFKVTEISPVDRSECSSYALDDLKPDDRLIRVKVDANAQAPMPGVTPRSSPAGVLISQFWNGVSDDGYVTPVKTEYGCIPNGDTSVYGPFHTTLGIGEKGRGEMVFAVPADSTKLSLHYFDTAGWTWDIPPAQ
ncbi:MULTISPECIES: hypothetical protein [Gordonia]|uniref:DUF4352 domain-containing protein n=1 Tax=Gordonia sihwensis NBRC 108236 TaxID=1223544 RepID=L7LIT6_9ACTN|nr:MULTISPECIES: hypothetical protein [Gordonia]GAC60656.1 hypothetical protein GSI01S_10_02520 [Gordonia sihwensis NBRC 108236]